MTLPSVGFAGVGLMGSGMAKCLLAAGHPLTVLVHRNRTPVEPLLAQGATEAPDPAALAQGAAVIVIPTAFEVDS